MKKEGTSTSRQPGKITCTIVDSFPSSYVRGLESNVYETASNNESPSEVENRKEQREGGGLCEECVSEDVCDDMKFCNIDTSNDNEIFSTII